MSVYINKGGFYLMRTKALMLVGLLVVGCTAPSPVTLDYSKPTLGTKQEATPVVGITNKDVLDGDTVIINNQKYRLACVDAPEVEHPAYGDKPASPAQDSGPEARELLMNIIMKYEGIQPGENLAISYNRVVTHLTTINEGKDVALMLVENGYAWASTDYPYCMDKAQVLKDAQARAQQAKLGMWVNGTNIQTPAEFRRSN
jgi:endonuclease YncB( thermonuclease family)